MPKEHIAGISYNELSSKIVVIDQQEDGIELHYLEETKKASEKDIWFLDSLVKIREKFSGKISKVSVALDNSNVFLYSFPLDNFLSQSEQNEQIQWELSHYIEDFKPKDYITEIHILKTKAREQLSEILAVSVKRSFLFNIQDCLLVNKFELKTVDTNHFGAQSSLLYTHPDVKARTVGLIGVEQKRIDFGIVYGGRLVAYKYSIYSTIEEGVNFIQDVVKDSSITEVFLYGDGVTFEFRKLLRSSIGIISTSLNPFRKIRISSSFKGFDKYIGSEHLFASCVGIVLMK